MVTFKAILFLLIGVAFDFSFAANKYCGLCQNERHAMCMYTWNWLGTSYYQMDLEDVENSKPTRDNCYEIWRWGLNQDEKNTILNRINSHRQKVAQGQERRGINGPQPAAVSIPNLVWDEELAKIAQIWANQCKKTQLEWYSCSDVERFNVAQSVYRKTTKLPRGRDRDDHRFEDLVDQWYNQVAQYNKDDISNHHHLWEVRDYVKMVWANTTHVGCGMIKWATRPQFNTLLVCNYGPGGDVNGHRVYDIKT